MKTCQRCGGLVPEHGDSNWGGRPCECIEPVLSAEAQQVAPPTVFTMVSEILEAVRNMNHRLSRVEQGVENMASNDQALTDAVTALTGVVQAEDTGIAAIIADFEQANSNSPDPAITDAITKLQALQQDIQTQTNNITTAITPAAPSTPSTPPASTPPSPASQQSPSEASS